MILNDENLVNNDINMSQDSARTTTNNNNQLDDDDIITLDSNSNNNNREKNSNEQASCSFGLRDLLDHCSYCKKKLMLSDIPKMLSCLHSYCDSCLNSICKNNKYSCIVCNLETEINLVINNIFTIDDDDNQTSKPKETKKLEQKCTNCDDNSKADWFCVDCDEWLCEECKIAHSRVKLTKDHVIERKTDSDTNDSSNLNNQIFFCQTHKRERLNLYCETCDTLTCRDCQLSQLHKDHKHKYVQEAAMSQREYFEDWLKKVKIRKSLINDVKTKIEDRQVEIDYQSDSIANEIKIISSKIAIEIINRANNLIDGLQKICKDKHSHLNNHKTDLQNRLNKFDHCINVIESVLKSDNKIGVLIAKKAFSSYVSLILDEKFEVLNPHHQFKIEFIHEDAKTIRSLTNLGYLNIDGQTYGMRNQVPNGPVTSSNTINHLNETNDDRNQASSEKSQNKFICMPSSTVLQTNGQSPKNVQQTSSNVGQFNPNNLQIVNKPLSGQIMPNSIQPLRNVVVSSPSRFQIYPSGFKTMHGLPLPNNSPTNTISQINKQYLTQNTSPNLSQLQRPNLNIQRHTIPIRFQKIAPQTSPVTLVDVQQRPAQPIPTLLKSQVRPSYSSSLPDKQLPEPREQQQNQLLALSVAQKRKSDDINLNSEVNQPNKTKSLSTIAENSIDRSQNIAKNLTIQVNGALKEIKKEKVNVITTKEVLQQNETSLTPSTGSAPLKDAQSDVQKETSNLSTRDSFDSSNQNQSNIKSLNRLKKDGIRTQSVESQLTTSTQDKGPDDELNETDNESNFVQNTITEGLVINENDIQSDICIICRTRGELLTCNFCPRSYHYGCHVPTINNKIEGSWRCGLCEDLESILKTKFDSESSTSINLNEKTSKRKAPLGLSKWELKVCERVLLLLYCQIGSSPFHQPVSHRLTNYYKIVKQPMDFSKIKHKLSRGHFDHYNSVEDFMSDVLLVFTNCALFNKPETSLAKAGNEIKQRFLNFFNQHLPEYVLNLKSNKSANNSLTINNRSNDSIENRSQLSPSSEASTSSTSTTSRSKRKKAYTIEEPIQQQQQQQQQQPQQQHLENTTKE